MVTALFSKENLGAWCIIPFDANNRTPQDRASMLHELGIQKLAYDWRNEQLTTFLYENKVLRDNNKI
jgi:hypothetical protein